MLQATWKRLILRVRREGQEWLCKLTSLGSGDNLAFSDCAVTFPPWPIFLLADPSFAWRILIFRSLPWTDACALKRHVRHVHGRDTFCGAQLDKTGEMKDYIFRRIPYSRDKHLLAHRRRRRRLFRCTHGIHLGNFRSSTTADFTTTFVRIFSWVDRFSTSLTRSVIVVVPYIIQQHGVVSVVCTLVFPGSSCGCWFCRITISFKVCKTDTWEMASSNNSTGRSRTNCKYNIVRRFEFFWTALYVWSFSPPYSLHWLQWWWVVESDLAGCNFSIIL